MWCCVRRCWAGDLNCLVPYKDSRGTGRSVNDEGVDLPVTSLFKNCIAATVSRQGCFKLNT